MFKYEVVTVKVSFSTISQAAKAIEMEADKRPNARLINQEVIQGPSTWSFGSQTKAIILTFETKVDE